jgi:D-alanine-D-alanine ligase
MWGDMAIEVNPEWWKTLFDDIYLITDARSVCDTELTRLEVDFFCKLLPMGAADRIVDLCGGHGRHSLELCARGYTSCLLVDYSPVLISSAKRSAADHNYPLACIRSDARNTGLTSAVFDYVLILGNSLGYLQESDADRQIIGEAFRLLRPGGWLLVDVTNGISVKENITRNAWHEIGRDTVVCRQRELVGDTISVREVVISKQSGLMRDESYAMRLYEPQIMESIIVQAGFENTDVITDLKLHFSREDCGCMDHRMIALGRKR